MGLVKKGSNYYSLPMEKDPGVSIPKSYPKDLLEPNDKGIYSVVQYRNTDRLKAWLIKGKRGWRKDHMTVLLRIVDSNEVRLCYCKKSLFGVGQHAGFRKEKLYSYAGYLWTDTIDAPFISRKDEYELVENQGKHTVESIKSFLENVAKYMAWDVFSGTGYCSSWLLVKDKGLLLFKWTKQGEECFSVSIFRRTAFIDLLPYERSGYVCTKSLAWATRKAKTFDVDEIADHRIKVY